MRLFVLAALLLSNTGVAAQDKLAPYSIKGYEVEGCACEIYCPCVWQQDASADHCQALLGYMIDDGMHGETDLTGTPFALAVTKAGKNLVHSMGSWEAILYVPANTTQAQRDALRDILTRHFGRAFAKLDLKAAEIEISRNGDKHQLKVGEIALLRAAPLKGANGKVPKIENAPFSVTEPTYCAKSELHTYNDGTTKWDFTGRNAYYGPFDYKGE